MRNKEQRIFRAGSSTYYWSARFYPKTVRADVHKLYSFVRVADDYVDSLPQQAQKFYALRKYYELACKHPGFDDAPTLHDTVVERVIKNIIQLSRKYRFDEAWVAAFLDSMQADLEGKAYKSLADTLRYVHGSAEVVGLMMARIMGLPPEADKAACMQGRALQWINFIRDIREDTEMGRCYFPSQDLKRCGLKDLHEASARANPAAFRQFMHVELERYHEYQQAAQQGLAFLPKKVRPALQTANDMYDWTAAQIAKDPFIVFVRQIRPGKGRVLVRGIRNTIA